jgi:hypothetical protein
MYCVAFTLFAMSMISMYLSVTAEEQHFLHKTKWQGYAMHSGCDAPLATTQVGDIRTRQLCFWGPGGARAGRVVSKDAQSI